jgi:hypothetical protein
MKAIPDYCKDCQLFKHVDVRPCPAGYRNPAKTLEGALRQANRKGEWPCSYSPHRGEFVEALGGKR